MRALLLLLLIATCAPCSAAAPRFPSVPSYAWPGPFVQEDYLPFDSTEIARFARLHVTRIEARRSDLPKEVVIYTLDAAGQPILETTMEQNGQRTITTSEQSWSYDGAGRMLSRVLYAQGRLDNYDSVRYDAQGRIVYHVWWLSGGRKHRKNEVKGITERTNVTWQPDGTGRRCMVSLPIAPADTAPTCDLLTADAHGQVVLVRSGNRIDSLAADVVTDTAVIRRIWYRTSPAPTPLLGREIVMRGGKLRSCTVYDGDPGRRVAWRQDYSYDEAGQLIRVTEGNGFTTTTFTYYLCGLWDRVIRVDPTSVVVTRYTYTFGHEGR